MELSIGKVPIIELWKNVQADDNKYNMTINGSLHELLLSIVSEQIK